MEQILRRYKNEHSISAVVGIDDADQAPISEFIYVSVVAKDSRIILEKKRPGKLYRLDGARQHGWQTDTRVVDSIIALQTEIWHIGF